MDPIDPRFVRGCVLGEKEAERAFVKHYKDYVWKIVAGILTPSSPDLLAATIETFRKAMLNLGRFDPTGRATLATWLGTIATRVALDFYKKKRRDAERHTSWEEMQEAGKEPVDVAADAGSTASPSPEALTGTKREALLVNVLMNNLDAEYRTVLIRKYWDSLSDEEIAEELGLPVGTVKTWHRRAKQELKVALDRAGYRL
jgi:RNA polymerase sigma-70 factor (ECF subfamily)